MLIESVYCCVGKYRDTQHCYSRFIVLTQVDLVSIVKISNTISTTKTNQNLKRPPQSNLQTPSSLIRQKIPQKKKHVAPRVKHAKNPQSVRLRACRAVAVKDQKVGSR